MAVRPDRARDLAGADLVDGGGQAGPAAVDLERPAGELEPERRRLGMDGVGPAHHRRVGLRPGPGDQRHEETIGIGQQPIAGLPQLERESGIHDVAAGQPEVQVAALRPDRLGDLRHERDDVVVGRPLDLGDAVDIDPGALLDRSQRGGRHETPRGLGAGNGDLDAEHLLEPGAIRPRGPHLGQRVAADHRAPPGTRTSAAMSWRRWLPSNVTASAARSAASRAAPRSGPRPTIVTTRPPAVR